MNAAGSVEDLVRLGLARNDSESAFQEFLARIPSVSGMDTLMHQTPGSVAMHMQLAATLPRVSSWKQLGVVQPFAAAGAAAAAAREQQQHAAGAGAVAVRGRLQCDVSATKNERAARSAPWAASSQPSLSSAHETDRSPSWCGSATFDELSTSLVSTALLPRANAHAGLPVADLHVPPQPLAARPPVPSTSVTGRPAGAVEEHGMVAAAHALNQFSQQLHSSGNGAGHSEGTSPSSNDREGGTDTRKARRCAPDRPRGGVSATCRCNDSACECSQWPGAQSEQHLVIYVLFRMLSNRESARRSRKRKQEHLTKLEQEVR